MKTMSKIGLVVSALMLAATVNASIVTNFYDSFSGSAATLLSNKVTDVGSGTWNSGGNIYRDGHFISGGTRQAYLPFTMEQGKVYTFTCDLTITNLLSTSADWVGIAIRTNGAPVSGNPNASVGPAYLFARRNGALMSSATGGAASTTTGVGVVSSTINLGMVLDTTAASATDWTISFTTNGGYFGSANQALPNSLVSGGTYYWTLGIFSGGSGSPAGTFDNVLVTMIPEPTTVGLFSISALGLLLLRRRLSLR